MIANRTTDPIAEPAPPPPDEDDDGMGPIGPEMAASLRDLNWFVEHYLSDLVPKYANKFVAVVDGRVVDSGDERSAVRARGAVSAGVPESRVVVEFVEW